MTLTATTPTTLPNMAIPVKYMPMSTSTIIILEASRAGIWLKRSSIKRLIVWFFNTITEMNRTKIEWCDYTWNPVVGCKFGCKYCYAKKINDRFHIIPDFTDPQFFSERLIEPSLVKKPSKIFVVSMGDLFGPWVDIDWIYQVIEVCKQNPQHTFMFLTKNRVGYNGFDFPDNCMLGITLTMGSQKNIDDFVYFSSGKRFISIEPILGGFEGIKFTGIDLVIVGAMTGPNPVIPKKEWIESIKHDNIFYKDNIKKYL